MLCLGFLVSTVFLSRVCYKPPLKLSLSVCHSVSIFVCQGIIELLVGSLIKSVSWDYICDEEYLE